MAENQNPAPKKRYVLIDSDAKATWGLHRADCPDLKKLFGNRTKVAARSIDSVLEWWIDDEMIEMGYTQDDIRILPCTKHAPVKEA